jgi:ATP-dependent DNA ligase
MSPAGEVEHGSRFASTAGQEFVVGGYMPNASSFESLLVGCYEGKRLLFASKVRSGFKPYVRSELFRQLLPLTVSVCPFANLPSAKTGHWGEGITAEDMAKLR